MAAARISAVSTVGGKGWLWPDESTRYADPVTGHPIRRITSHPSIHHHPFFFVPCFDRNMKRLILVSHRTGRAQLFAENQTRSGLIQLTDRADLAEWSIHPSHDGKAVFFTAGTAAWRLDLESLEEVQLAEFGNVAMRERGMVGAAMGTTALSHDDRWWAVPVRAGSVTHFHRIDTARGGSEVFLERDTIGHPQFHPDDSSLLFFAGPLTNRIWCTTLDGTRVWNPYPRTDPLQWITHEMWIPGTRELAFVDWPRGMRAVNVETGASRWLTRFPAWHASIDASGRRAVCDTTFPDRGVHLIDLATGAATPLFTPASSNAGSHWGEPFPYNNGPVEVYAPQHTHPHPRFSPDGQRVIFTSDASGHAQLYECVLPRSS
jgi:oligogalacturonide lyase